MVSPARLSEAELLDRIGRIKTGAKHVEIGIGDDAAALRHKGLTLISADMLVEGQDFDFAWATWKDVGCKAAAANLSDIAAMGGQPTGLLVSLAVPKSVRPADVLALLSALHGVGSQFDGPLVGGDLSAIDGPVVASVTVLGQVTRPWRRHRARVGDHVIVTGSLGEAALGLRELQKLGQRPKRLGRAMSRQLRPTPQLEAAQALRALGCVRSAADVSDGLARDIGHLLAAGQGFALSPSRVPTGARFGQRCSKVGADPVALAVAGGEDFELVMAVAPKDVASCLNALQSVGVRGTDLGQVTRGDGVTVVGVPQQQLGFDHFARGV